MREPEAGTAGREEMGSGLGRWRTRSGPHAVLISTAKGGKVACSALHRCNLVEVRWGSGAVEISVRKLLIHPRPSYMTEHGI